MIQVYSFHCLTSGLIFHEGPRPGLKLFIISSQMYIILFFIIFFRFSNKIELIPALLEMLQYLTEEVRLFKYTRLVPGLLEEIIYKTFASSI